MATGKIHVGLTTIQPSTADRLKLEHEKRGCHYIAAPVVGRPDAAAEGKLITFIAGEPQAITIVQPTIESYTEKQIPVGTVASSANGMKICVNYMAMAQLAMLGEVFTFAEKLAFICPYKLDDKDTKIMSEHNLVKNLSIHLVFFNCVS